MTVQIRKMFKSAIRFAHCEKGATAIEYGLIAALIAVAAITSMKGLGNQLKTTFSTTSSSMSAANATAAA